MADLCGHCGRDVVEADHQGYRRRGKVEVERHEGQQTRYQVLYRQAMESGTSLITGGAGFIGSHLAEHLLERGERVILWDDLSTGSEANLRHLRGHPRCRVAIGDVAKEPAFLQSAEGVERVFHLAASVGVRRVLDDPIRAIRNNLRATDAACQAASRAGARLLLASSSEVYGRSDAVPFSEESDVSLGPTSRLRFCYGAAKAVDEHLTLAYHQALGLPVVVVRLFNVAGPRQSAEGGMVLPNLIAQALAGGPLLVHGDGLQRRCFSHVADTVWALARLLDCPDAEGAVVNLGSDQEITILELAQRVAQRVDRRLQIELVPYSEAMPRGFEDIRRRVPDLGRLRSLLGSPPGRSLDDIIDDILASIEGSPLASTL